MARWPILSRCFSIRTPGVSSGTMNAEIPRCPALGSVFANTTLHDAWPAFVMNVFEPLRAYSSPRRSAVVFMRATSEPASGSESPNEHRIGSSRSGVSHAAFCFSLPAMITGAAPRPFAPIEVAMPEQPQYSSSATSIPSKALSPGPPSDSGTWRFMRPSSCACAMTSAGWVACSSYPAAFGRISFSANSRARARSSLCSGVSAKDTPGATLVSVSVAVTARPFD